MSRVSISPKLVVIILLIGLLVISFGTFNYLYTETKSAIRTDTRNELMSLAGMVATQVNGSALSSLQPGDESTSEFLRIQNMLYEMEQSNPDIRYIYTMRRNGDQISFIVDADYGIESDAASIGEIYASPTSSLLEGFSSVTADGEFYTDRWGTFLSGYAPVRNSSGAVVGIIGVDMSADRALAKMNFLGGLQFLIFFCGMVIIATGIVGVEMIRSRSEKKLRESEEQFRTIFHNQQAGLLMIDRKTHRITDANTSALSLIGASREDVVGKVCHTVVCPSEAGKCPVTDLGQSVDRSERSLLTKSGEKIPVIKTVDPITIQGRQFLIESFMDIGDRKRAEEAIRRANARSAFLTSLIRHDIMNQLSINLGFLHMIREDPENVNNSEYLDFAGRSAQKIQNILAFTRIYEKVGSKPPSWQKIRPLIEQATRGESFGSLSFSFDIPDVEVYADPNLAMVFTQLIQNAATHGGPGVAKVTFSAWESADGLLITCEDDGLGIPPDQKERCFERNLSEGKAMGLFLTREILSVTEITIKETGEYGRGARFEFIVPRGAFRFLR